MRPWNEIIAEARDRNKEKAERERRLKIVKTRLKGSDALRKTQGKRKSRLTPDELKLRDRDTRVRERRQDTREKENERKDAHSKWVIGQAAKNAEERKKKQLKDIKDSPRKAASAALSSISKPQSISYKDSDATAYTKAIGNAASLAGGVAKAGIHYFVAKHKAKKAAAELENPPKPPGGGSGPGGPPPPPPGGGSGPGGPPPPPPGGGGGKPPKPPGGLSIKPRKKLIPLNKRLPPAKLKMLPPSGGTQPSSVGKSLGQQARENPELKKKMISQRNQSEEYSNWREELLSENNSIENLHEFLPALLAALRSGGAAGAASVASGAGRAAAAGETGLGSKVSNVIKKTVKNKLGDGDNSSNSQSSSSSSEEPISSNDSSATAYTKALSNVGKIFSREEFVAEVEDKEAKRKKIIDVMRGKNKIELNPNMKEEKDEEGGMAHNELATMERAVKTLRKKIKSPNQQLPAWVQSKISKAADHIDTVADYMSGETEPVSEGYDDMNFRHHAKGTLDTSPTPTPSEKRSRTAGVLKLMKQVNADVEKPKKKKKKKSKDVVEDCGCEDDKKKVLMMAIIKKVVDAKKKKNSQLNSGIIGEESAAWQRKEGKNPEGGLNKKGIASYRRENPGSKLSLAVTTPPSKLDPDSKSAKRRKSFCARMGGMPGPMKDEKGRPTRKALSLRKWNC